MSQDFDPFHVPQQNRRNKLRVNTSQTQPQTQTQQSQILMMNNNNNNNNPSDPLQQGLSLSLSFQLLDHDNQRYNNAVSVLGDFLKHNNGGASVISSVPLGPFTGYALILKNSRFLKPAQQVLDDLCGAMNSDFFDFSMDFSMESDVLRGSFGFNDDQLKDSRLMFLLDEVYKKYKLYCQQMQAVVASFETVAGLGNAAPYICYAIKTVSKHFTFLKNALLYQIQFPELQLNKKSPKSHEKCQNSTMNFSNFLQHPVWRSQRGLPDHAVALLKTWLYEHFLHPYPTDSEKQILAQHTGLSRTQVSNWFINARVRLWKPMVEEVYKLSSQQQPQVPLNSLSHNINPSHNLYQHNPESDSDNIKITKRSRHQLNISDDHIFDERHGEENTNNLVPFNNYQAGISGSNDVSLALGLNQNNYGSINIGQHVNNLQLFGLMGSGSDASF